MSNNYIHMYCLHRNGIRSTATLNPRRTRAVGSQCDRLQHLRPGGGGGRGEANEIEIRKLTPDTHTRISDS